MKKRISFYELFEMHPDGSIEPKKPINIGGISLGRGVRFTRGVLFAGIDLTLFIGKDFEVEELADGTTKILGVYQ